MISVSNLKIKICNSLTDELLYEFDSHQSDQAYAMASQLEEMGIAIIVNSPTISDMLSDSLEVQVDDEYTEFDESCCHSFLDTVLRMNNES